MSNFGADVLDGRIHALYHYEHQVYDPAAARWVAAEGMPTSRHGQGVVALGSSLYAIGGGFENPQFDLNVTEALVPTRATSSADGERGTRDPAGRGHSPPQ